MLYEEALKNHNNIVKRTFCDTIKIAGTSDSQAPPRHTFKTVTAAPFRA